ncbi:MAG: hypothetical protein ACJ8AT_37735 [Hyalangium sp.]|uniref:hypothetical protein n=1 Tax=Hyalangium sp. TaxID=2028555 RepID=UPI00389A3638
MSDGQDELFRRQALEHHAGAQEYGRVLRLPPSWTPWTLALLLGAAVFFVGFTLLGRLSVYATGPAVVRLDERTEPTAQGSAVVTALLPGEYRSRLRVGSPLRLELRGFPSAYQELVIQAVGEALVEPDEARRYLGLGQAESLEVHGAMVAVRARLPARTFEVEGRPTPYSDGMPGTAHVRVTSEPILLALVPSLEALLR